MTSRLMNWYIVLVCSLYNELFTMSQVEVQAERDPTRLYQLTQGLKERRKDTTSTSGGPVLHMPHR